MPNKAHVTLSDVLQWVWRGKSITRAMMNSWLARRVGKLEGVVYDLGGGGTPSYKDVLHLPSTFYNVDMMAEAMPTIVADIEKPLPIAEGTADVVLLFNTLEHVFHYQHVIDEMYRILKPGGRVIVYVPFMVGFHTFQGKGFFINDYFRYSQSALDRIFHQSGFRQIKIVPLGGLYWVMADLAIVAVRFRVLRWMVAAILGTIERTTARLRRFDSSSKYPIGYFVEAVK